MTKTSDFQFGTKAETLARLVSKMRLGTIPDFMFFSVEEWIAKSDDLIAQIKRQFAAQNMIVRSSAVDEDSSSASMTGAFLSVSHVTLEHPETLNQAIKSVIGSFDRTHKSLGQHQVIVQRMIHQPSMSGVVMTADLSTGAPYYVINYDDESGRTDTVTAGIAQAHRTLIVARDFVEDLSSPRFKALLEAVQEIERITGSDRLDIEFAVDEKNCVFIFQVRPIAAQKNWTTVDKKLLTETVPKIKDQLEPFFSRQPGVFGEKSVLTAMSDWNPAEMIGSCPRPLSASLYRYLITDGAWRTARILMGYHPLPARELMMEICGKPFIDVRLSFNSFLPAGLPAHIAEKLVDGWLTRLRENKLLHDKVEFEVAITCASFDFDDLSSRLLPGTVSKAECLTFKEYCNGLTKALLEGKTAPITGELKKIERLARSTRKKSGDLRDIVTLLDECVTLGTIPFSILARHAFIATSFLRSLVARAVADEETILRFRQSIHTVAGDLIKDSRLVAHGELPKKILVERYGHLRPGTYDILSLRYDQREDLMTTLGGGGDAPIEQGHFSFSRTQHAQIGRLLREFSYDVDSHSFEKYLREAIAAREYAKFIFTRHVSNALESIARFGEQTSLSRDNLSFLRIEDLINRPHAMKEISAQRREKHRITQLVRLPYVIEREEDASIIPLLLHRPNFITHASVRAPTAFLSGLEKHGVDLQGKIVLIESADPGFDWIFSRSIAGLITKFGGANSHMAIRAAEFGLPAAIGCGEQIFERARAARFVELDCNQQRIEPISV